MDQEVKKTRQLRKKDALARIGSNMDRESEALSRLLSWKFWLVIAVMFVISFGPYWANSLWQVPIYPANLWGGILIASYGFFSILRQISKEQSRQKKQKLIVDTGTLTVMSILYLPFMFCLLFAIFFALSREWANFICAFLPALVLGIAIWALGQQIEQE